MIKKHILAFFFIAILAVAIYSNTFNAAFHYDDFSSIVANPEVHLEELSIRNVMGFWWIDRPLAYLTFALNYYFGGLDPVGYHVINVVIHIISGMLLYFFLHKTFTLPLVKERYGQTARWLALFSSLLWISNPVQTQAVTYIVQRMTEMASMFYIISLLFFVYGRISSGTMRWFHWSLAIISFFLSLLSKEIALTIPIVIAIYEVCFFRRWSIKRILKEKYTYISLIGVVLFIWFVTYTVNVFPDLPTTSFPLKERIYTESRVIIYYLTLLLFPLPEKMSLNYDFPLSRTIMEPVSTFFSLAFLLILLIYSVNQIGKRPLFSFLALWFLISISTEAMVVGLELVFEHRLYLPSMAFFPLLSLGGAAALERGRFVRFLTWGVAIVIVLAFSANTYKRNGLWVDGFSIYADSVRKYPGSVEARMNLGTYYLNEGMADEAIAQFKEVLKMNPRKADARWYLGNSYFKKGEFDKAAGELERAIELGNTWVEVYGSLGDAYAKGGKLEKAEEAYKRVLEMAPEGPLSNAAKAAIESVRRMKEERGKENG